MTAPVVTMEPGFLGSPEAQRLTIYHPPRAEVRDRAVLLCYPAGHEYVRGHACFRRLADRLARSGVPVLRFDLSGTGDSSGELDAFGLDDWITDVAHAVAHLRDRTGIATIDVVGLRIGATIAAMATSRGVMVDRLVLWQPIISGRGFVSEMEHLHRECLTSFGLVAPSCPVPPDQPMEVLGFEYGRPMLRDLERLDMMSAPPPRARAVLLVDNTDDRDQEPLARHLEQQGVRISYAHRPDSAIWLAEPYQQIIPTETIGAIMAWLSEDAS